MTRDVSVRITADSAQFQAALGQAVQALNNMSSQMAASLNNLRGLFGGLSQSAQQMGSTVNNNTTNLLRLNQNFNNVGTAVSNTTNRITVFNTTSGASTGSVNALSSNIQQLIGTINQMNGSLNTLNTTLTTTGSRTQQNQQSTGGYRSSLQSLHPAITAVTGALMAMAAAFSAKKLLDDSRAAIVAAEASFRGLEAVANSTGLGVGKAMEVAGRLSADGLVTTADASKALQQLLARGYSVDQAEKTLIRLKDAAAFNRQSHLTMSQAVLTAAEGLKAENSILVDNAGVTKNVAKMWEEYAKAKKITTEQMTLGMKIEAEYLGIQKETEAQVGNAAIAAKGLQGEQAALHVAYTNLTEVLGQALLPIYQAVGTVVKDFMEKMTLLIKIIQSSGAYFAYATEVVGNFMKAMASGNFSNFRKELKLSQDALDDYLKTLYSAKGAIIDPLQNTKQGKPINVNEGGKDNKQKEEEAKSKQIIEIAKIEADKKEQIYKQDLVSLKQQLDKKLLSYSDYAKKAIAIENSIVDAQKGFLQVKLEQVTSFFTKEKDVEKKTNLETDKIKVQAEIDKLEQTRRGIGQKISGQQPKVSGGGGGRSTVYREDNSEYKVARANLEAQYSLFKTNADAERNLVENKYKRNAISAQNYYAEINRLEQEDFKKREQLINQEIAENKKKRPQNKSDENSQKVELIKLESDLKVLQSERAEAEKQNIRELKLLEEDREKARKLRSLDSGRDKSSADASLERIEAEKQFALRKIDADKLLELEKATEVKMFESTRLYYEKKKALYAGDVEALAQIQQEIENETLNHNIRLAQIDKERQVNSQKSYTELFDSTEDALSKFFNSASKEPKKLGDAVKSMLEDIASALRKNFSDNLAKQIMGKDFMSDLMGMLSGSSKGGSSSSSSSGGGGMFGGLGSMFSGFGSWVSNLLSFDVGTNYVPQDMVAKIHKGERIVPARYNNEQSLGGKGMSVNNTFVLSGPATRSTQTQLANAAASAIFGASRRNNS